MMDHAQTSSLINTLKTGQPADRSRAISALRNGLVLPDDRKIMGQVMSQALGDNEPVIRAEAAEALGEADLVEWHPALLRALEGDEDATVRACAAEALGDAGNVAAIPSLERALCDPDDAVRGYAASALGLVGSVESLAAISARLDKEGSSSRFDMMAAMIRLVDTPHTRRRLLEALTGLSDADAYRALNVLEDLLSRVTPPGVLAEAAELRTILKALRLQLDPSHIGHLDGLLRALDDACARAGSP